MRFRDLFCNSQRISDRARAAFAFHQFQNQTIRVIGFLQLYLPDTCLP